jgi:hypothetical protein
MVVTAVEMAGGVQTFLIQDIYFFKKTGEKVFDVLHFSFVGGDFLVCWFHNPCAMCNQKTVLLFFQLLKRRLC